MQRIEVNFDGLVGPTHHFGGLGVGNLASQQHGGQLARPRAAALQGLQKMRALHALGAPQAVLPPQRRPALAWLRRLGFRGDPARLLRAAAAESPVLLSAAWSASAMWTANAATVTAAGDAADGRTHLSVANLCSSLHRSLEPPHTLRLLRAILCGPDFAIHAPLPAALALRDEGAANHMRLFAAGGRAGINVFVYGASDLPGDGELPGADHPAGDAASPNSNSRFPPRQTLAASRAIARRHRLRPGDTFFLQQHPQAIAAGAFHNDVVATSWQHVLLHHEQAFLDRGAALEQIERAYARRCGQPLQRIEIGRQQLSLADAVSSYLFNSQLIADPDDPQGAVMVCPMQVAEQPAAAAVARRLVEDRGPVRRVEFVELRESMSNGGGPACLRLRVPMTVAQYQSLPEGIRWSESLADRLTEIVQQTYPETLCIDDLASPQWIAQADAAVDALRGAMLTHS